MLHLLHENITKFVHVCVEINMGRFHLIPQLLNFIFSLPLLLLQINPLITGVVTVASPSSAEVITFTATLPTQTKHALPTTCLRPKLVFKPIDAVNGHVILDPPILVVDTAGEYIISFEGMKEGTKSTFIKN